MLHKKLLQHYEFKNKFLEDIASELAYVDIETSGFSAQYNNIISITILIRENDKYYIYQSFSSNEEKECEDLIDFYNLIKSKKYIVTYNGKSFDIPFINTSMSKYGLPYNLNDLISIDLYKDMRILNRKLNIPNVKLKTVEKYFDIFRQDQLSGSDVVELYNLYMRNKQDKYMKLILEHNFEDVSYLPIIFDNILCKYDYSYYSQNLGLLKVENATIKVNQKNISIKFESIYPFKIDHVINHDSFNFNCKKNTLSASLNISVSFYKDASESIIIFIDNKYIGLEKFDSFNGLHENIIPIKLNEHIIFKNIHHIIDNILVKLT